MDRWQDKIAVVTGASSGIGNAVSQDLLKNGVIVVGLARREERLKEIRNNLPEKLQSRFHPLKCDVTVVDEVNKCFEWIEKNLGGTDILINNAGIFHFGYLSEMDSNSMSNVLNTNVMAFANCTREAFNSMKNRNFNGHVIVINSILGHLVPNMPQFPINMYSPSKFAVTSMVELYRQEFFRLGTKVKITSVSPGMVNTEMIPQEAKNLPNIAILEPENISGAILYAIATPPNVQIHEIIIKPMGEKM